uniref:Uncharacterized protein n=1 Tax=Romanomermis culicivorax TaxID=13658 RepID=A0A915IYK5_ROMCU
MSNYSAERQFIATATTNCNILNNSCLFKSLAEKASIRIRQNFQSPIGIDVYRLVEDFRRPLFVEIFFISGIEIIHNCEMKKNLIKPRKTQNSQRREGLFSSVLEGENPKFFATLPSHGDFSAHLRVIKSYNNIDPRIS